jgi:hypothetical protein
MKHFLPLIAILGLSLACAPPNKLASIEKTQDSVQKEKRIHIEKQIAPGTCSLTLAECQIISENNNQWLVGNVISINAYGAGFLSVFEKKQTVRIRITEQQSINLKAEKTISCLLSSIEGLNNNPYYKLVDYKLQNKE